MSALCQRRGLLVYARASMSIAHQELQQYVHSELDGT